MTSMAFKIRGLDCAEEVAALKAELGPLVGDVDRLSFDLINGKLMLEAGDPSPAAESIVSAVARTGMRAIAWDDFVRRSAEGVQDSFWVARGRTVLCVTSGACVVLGTALHGATHGWADAFGGHGEEHAYPLLAIGLYIAALLSGAWYVFPKAVFAARRLRPDMNLLMVVAMIGAVGIGEWMEAGTVAFLFSLALLLESWSVGRARRAIGALVDLSPTVARVRCPHHGDIDEKPVEEVGIGATVLVRPGERIPLDGVVSKGRTTVNQAPITGESEPIEKEIGGDVFAGSINNEGAFEFEVTRAADDTTLARIIHMVEEAQSRRAPSEQWVERFARVYTPGMMGLALAVMVLPPLFAGGDWRHWFYQALVILVIACPCALVISTPVSIVAGLASAAKAGVLIKGGVFLEAAGQLKALAFDKTGTLTEGRPKVQTIVPLNGHSEMELLARAASMESESVHPIARAILREARERGLDFEPAENLRTLEGKGAEATFNGQTFWIGTHRLLHEKTAETDECEAAAAELEDAGHTVVAVGNSTHVCGLISVADAVRPHSKAIVAELKRAGIETVAMLTGDNRGTAEAVAKATGVDEFQSELLPDEKARAVEELRERYGRVAMVGDGINDAPALATATVGIAMGAAGSDAAIETADIALMSDDLTRIPWLIAHSRRTLRVIKQNIAFALGLKLVFVALALFGLATLWMAIAADMGASLLVIANGLRLLRA